MSWPFFQKKLVNDTGHVHKKSNKSILQPCCTLDFSHFRILTPKELLGMCGCVCGCVRESKEHGVLCFNSLFYVIALCFAVPLANLHL